MRSRHPTRSGAVRLLSLIENPYELRDDTANYLWAVELAGWFVPGCMLARVARPMPTAIAAPAINEAATIIIHIFRVTFMFAPPKFCQADRISHSYLSLGPQKAAVTKTPASAIAPRYSISAVARAHLPSALDGTHLR